jgi:hypothetical protein
MIPSLLIVSSRQVKASSQILLPLRRKLESLESPALLLLIGQRSKYVCYLFLDSEGTRRLFLLIGIQLFFCYEMLFLVILVDGALRKLSIMLADVLEFVICW